MNQEFLLFLKSLNKHSNCYPQSGKRWGKRVRGKNIPSGTVVNEEILQVEQQQRSIAVMQRFVRLIER